MLIVQKFGGSSVADAAKLRRVAGIIADAKKAGNDVIVVLSAQGDTTDDLIAKAHEISPEPNRRELDMLMVTGEQISISLCAMALQELGIPAISLLGWQVRLRTSSEYGSARIRSLDTERIQQELDQGKVVLVAGFQGVNRRGDMTTLGRGGSDTTAVAIAAKMHADLCQIYTDVEGVERRCRGWRLMDDEGNLHCAIYDLGYIIIVPTNFVNVADKANTVILHGNGGGLVINGNNVIDPMTEMLIAEEDGFRLYELGDTSPLSWIGVNPNTVMRTYEKLTMEGVIYNKRGIGYFITAEARKIVLENSRKEFLETELPVVIRKMELLGLNPKELFDNK